MHIVSCQKSGLLSPQVRPGNTPRPPCYLSGRMDEWVWDGYSIQIAGGYNTLMQIHELDWKCIKMFRFSHIESEKAINIGGYWSHKSRSPFEFFFAWCKSCPEGSESHMRFQICNRIINSTLDSSGLRQKDGIKNPLEPC
ncbi:MAG: hypothetical protein JWM47_4109 [Acidimicrobiales bacterium]|nr:hypothetical protein [Acidimicrobiales bacterium]